MNNFIIIFFILCKIEALSLKSDQKFRRSELIISGFNDSSLSNVIHLTRKVKITINNKIVHTRTLSSLTTSAFNEFIYHDVANDYPDHIDMNGYFYPNQTLSELLFNGPVAIMIQYYTEDESYNVNELETTNLGSDIRCSSNADHVRTYKGKRIEFNYFISYWCKGYTGKGCEYECETYSSSKSECHNEMEQKIVKNKDSISELTLEKQNAFSCIDNPCQNNGRCVQLANNQQYCSCASGWTGYTCTVFECFPACNPDFGKCVGANKCECSEGRVGNTCNEKSCTNNFCLNNGACYMFQNEVVCNCAIKKYAGRKCEVTCNPTCEFGSCVEENKQGKCFCFDGYKGQTCNETIPLPPVIYDSYLADPRNQKLLHFYILVSLSVFAIFCILISLYVRKYRQNKMVSNQLKEYQKNAVHISNNNFGQDMFRKRQGVM